MPIPALTHLPTFMPAWAARAVGVSIRMLQQVQQVATLQGAVACDQERRVLLLQQWTQVGVMPAVHA